MNDKPSKLAGIQALGQSGLARQYVKSGGAVATPAEVAALRGQGEIASLKRRIAELELEVAHLKRELASRPETSDVTLASNRKGDVTLASNRKAAAARQRHYRERKKAAGK